jgi:lipopolysaccharide biosynthesis protein
MQDICLFAHFDRDGVIDDYVFRYLAKIRDQSFSIVFITTSPISESDRRRLALYCDDVIQRENAGLDFGSWAAGFEKHRSAMTGRLLLANDSVYGPIGELGPALQRLTAVEADFYGLVESIDISPHLQSWFLLFEKHVVRDRAFDDLLRQPFSKMSKADIIKHGEVELSARLNAAGWRYRALYFASRSSLLSRVYPFHPMHYLWREMIKCEGIPFVKVELLRDNPDSIYDVVDVKNVVEARDPGLWKLIRAHQARIASSSKIALSQRRQPALPWAHRLLQLSLQRAYHAKHEGRRLAEISISAISIAAITAWRLLRLLCPRQMT